MLQRSGGNGTAREVSGVCMGRWQVPRDHGTYTETEEVGINTEVIKGVFKWNTVPIPT